jgi:flagellar protein FliO/FliZ
VSPISDFSSLFRRLPLCRLFRLLGASALLLPLAAFCAAATETPPAPPGVSLSTMVQTFAGLAIILGLFVAAAWLMRRMNGGNPFMAGNGPMRILSSLPVGARERIVLIEIEDTWLVVGIAPGQVQTLHTLPKGTLPAESLEGKQFGHWLKQFREQRKDVQP